MLLFFNHDQRLEVVLLFPQNAETLKGIQAVICFRKLKIVKPSDTRWLSHERQFAGNCLHCCKHFHSYTSHQEMLRHMVYTPF